MTIEPQKGLVSNRAGTRVSLKPGYRVRDEYGERGELTIVVEYWFARVQ